MPQPRSAILFLCVSNSARSQLAEALAKRLAPPGLEIFSAGSSPGRVHPYAVRVLQEVGIDIGAQFSKAVDAVPRERIGTVITLCAEEVCPVFPGDVERLHWPCDDPVGVGGGEQDTMAAFRKARENIRERLTDFFAVREAAGT